MRNISGRLGLIALFAVSFSFFLYLSFPYGVLKEALSAQVQMASGMTVRIEDLGPAFPFGFRATGVEVIGGGGAKIGFSRVSIRLGLLQLLLLRLGISVDAQAANKGYLDLDLGFPIFKIFATGGALPSAVSLEAKNFPLDGFVSYALKQAASTGSAGAMAGPLLGALGFKGNLDGEVSVNLDSSNVAQSTGTAKLVFSSAALILSDPSIGLPDQVFKSAKIQADMNSGTLKIDPSTRFMADEMELGIDGKINLKASIPASDLDLKVLVHLGGGLGEKFGWVMDGLSGGASKGGHLSMQVRGTIEAPVTAGL